MSLFDCNVYITLTYINRDSKSKEVKYKTMEQSKLHMTYTQDEYQQCKNSQSEWDLCC